MGKYIFGYVQPSMKCQGQQTSLVWQRYYHDMPMCGLIKNSKSLKNEAKQWMNVKLPMMNRA